MSAIVRLKRHLCEEPLEALVVNCKRQKRDDDSEQEDKKTLLKFAGTIKEQDEDFVPHIAKLNKSDLEQTYKKHNPDVASKSKQDFKDSSKNSRFKIVNLSRSINTDKETVNNTDDEKLAVTVLDIESEDPKDKDKSADANFVYDLYYTNSDDFGDCLDDTKAEEYLRVLPAGEELVFDNYREVGALDNSDLSSEDSNAENDWRNDYPDEEDDSMDESAMIKAVTNLNFNEDNLSSDDGEEGFVYSIDSEAAGFEEDLDQSDVRRYGEMYARFKARQKREEESYNKDIYDDIDEDDEDYYD